MEEMYRRNACSKCEQLGVNQRKALIEKKENGEVIAYSVFSPEVEDDTRDYRIPFSREIEYAIRDRNAYTVSDAAIKYNQMGGHQKIVNASTKEELSNTLFYKEQGKNTVVGAEAIALLKVIVVLERKGYNVEEGKVTIGLDNKKVH